MVQVYLRSPATVDEPPLVLRAYGKTPVLAPGEAASVSLELSWQDLCVWSETSNGWTPVRGHFGLQVGSSSRDIRLEHTLKMRARRD